MRINQFPAKNPLHFLQQKQIHLIQIARKNIYPQQIHFISMSPLKFFQKTSFSCSPCTIYTDHIRKSQILFQAKKIPFSAFNKPGRKFQILFYKTLIIVNFSPNSYLFMF